MFRFFITKIFVFIFFAFFLQNVVYAQLNASFEIEGGTNIKCLNDTVSFLNTSTNYQSQFWSFGDGYESYFKNPKHIYKNSGIFNVKLITFDLDANSDTFEILLTISSAPNFTLEPQFEDTTLLFGQSVNVVATGDYVSLLWSNQSNSNNLLVTSSGAYFVVATNEIGCSLKREFNVKINIDSIKNEISTKAENNILTPNGDGRNDFLLFKCIEDNILDCEISIYNKYGRLVFYEKNYKNGFSGKDKNGLYLQSGTYYYITKFSNAIGTSGYVDLLK